jgi:hypothetical protein
MFSLQLPGLIKASSSSPGTVHMLGTVHIPSNKKPQSLLDNMEESAAPKRHTAHKPLKSLDIKIAL